MNAFKQALTEVFQSYKLIYKPIIKRWRIKNAITIANSRFIETGIQHFVLHHDKHDCEVMSRKRIETNLKLVKRNDKRFRNHTMQDIRDKAIYVTESKVYSGNLNTFGIEMPNAKPVRVKYHKK